MSNRGATPPPAPRAKCTRDERDDTVARSLTGSVVRTRDRWKYHEQGLRVFDRKCRRPRHPRAARVAAASYRPEVVVRANEVAARAPDDASADERVEQVKRLK